MRHARGLASALALWGGSLAWSTPAEACGIGGIGAGAWLAAAVSLLIVLLMSIVSLVSMRAAGRAVGRMRRQRDGRGLRVGHVAIVLGFGVSAVATILSGGLLLALVLLG
jgi:heme exporter protein D